jgi:hypothetical protein
MGKRIIAIVGATNAAGRGLVRAIMSDKDSRFTARVVTLDVHTEAARALAKLGAEIVVGHPDAGPGLTAAFEGAYGAFCVPVSPDSAAPQRELAETTAVAKAAKDAGLLHVIWATMGDTNSETARMFRYLGIPATFLHPTGDPASLRGDGVAEELGRCAYGIFKSGEYIGRTVSINADLLTGHSQKRPGDQLSPRKSRFLRAQVIVPALVVVALVGAALVRNSLLESEMAHTAEMGDMPETAEPAEPLDTTESARAAEPPHAVEAPQIVTAKRPDPIVEPTRIQSPPAPTVTSRWEEERAASLKRKAAATAATATASKFQSPARVRQKKQPAHTERARAPTESPPPSRQESPPAPRPVAVAAVEAPVSRAPAEPAAPPPPPNLPSARGVEPRAAPPPAPGTIDQKAVTSVVRAHAAEVRACFDRAVMEHPELRGRLNVQATIDPDGHVLSASPTSTIENGARLQACVVGAFQNWTFPAPSGGVKGRVTYSFSFE